MLNLNAHWSFLWLYLVWCSVVWVTAKKSLKNWTKFRSESKGEGYKKITPSIFFLIQKCRSHCPPGTPLFCAFLIWYVIYIIQNTHSLKKQNNKTKIGLIVTQKNTNKNSLREEKRCPSTNTYSTSVPACLLYLNIDKLWKLFLNKDHSSCRYGTNDNLITNNFLSHENKSGGTNGEVKPFNVLLSFY